MAAHRGRIHPVAGCGLGCAFVALMAVAVGVYFLAWAGRGIRTAVAGEQQWLALASAWQPPARDAGAGELFPAVAGGYQRVRHDRSGQAPELRTDRPVRHAVYTRGSRTIELYVYRVNELERKALFQRVKKAVDARSGGFKGTAEASISIGDARSVRMWYRYGRPHREGYLWWDDGCLLLVRGTHPGEPEAFLKAYLRETSGRRPAGRGSGAAGK